MSGLDDDLREASAGAGAMVGDAPRDTRREADVVPRVAVRRIEVKEVDAHGHHAPMLNMYRRAARQTRMSTAECVRP